MTISNHYSIAQIARICHAKWVSKNETTPLPKYLSLDSRKINVPADTIFFAVKSSPHTVFRLVSELYEKGTRNFVIDQTLPDLTPFSAANILWVPDSIKALQEMAAWHRQQMRNKVVIGITGSNGKTVVKEWLNHLLCEEFSIVRSPKSYNSQIGVPLSILNMLAVHTLGIFEAGISLPGEMEKLEKIIQPQIGIITNIGQAHNEGFINEKQKLQEKLKLFKHSRLLIFCADKRDISAEIYRLQKDHPRLKLLSWGEDMAADLRITRFQKHFADSSANVSTEGAATFIEGIYLGKNVSVNIPFQDEAAIENALHCLCCILALEKGSPEVLKRFESLEPLAMRLELKPAINQCTIINDSYSNDLQSLRIALDFLRQQKQHTKRTIIFSDMLESGMPAAALYKEVAGLLQQHQVSKLIGIGPQVSLHGSVFSNIEKSSFHQDTESFLKNIQLHHFHNENILIKGARKFRFEKISQVLETKIHQTVLSINLNNLVNNFKRYKEKLNPGTKIMVMVKASGYGSGSHEIASVLEYNKVDFLAVAYTDEGVELRNAGITSPIMIMNIDESAFDLIVNYDLQPEIFSFQILHAFLHYLKANDIDNYPVHLKIDTGMHRLGFLENEIADLANLLSNNKFVTIKSAFSHLAASNDESEDNFTMWQFRTFQRCSEELEKIISYPFLKHIANTTAISRFPALQMDMVRLGIGLYGIDSSPNMQAGLRNVSNLKTTISQIKRITARETVGYGRSGKVLKDSTIATVRIGYADGYPRSLGNGKGKMLVRNQLVPVIGNVCMDMTMLDVTGIADVREGDEVIVFGESPTLPMLAAWADTIPYEIMTGISQRVKRVYFEE